MRGKETQMSKFYGTVVGSAKTEATRRGHDRIKVSAQSWDASVTTELSYNAKGELMVAVYVAEGSSTRGDLEFYGTMNEFLNQLRK